MARPRKKTQTLPTGEELLVDYARQLRRHKKGRRAVHIRLSYLTRYYRQEHHLRAASEAFHPLLRRFEGQLFKTSSGDLIYACKGARVADIDEVVLKIRFMFREDEKLKQAEGSDEDPFCQWFDIEKDADGFYTFARDLLEQENATKEAARPRIAAPLAVPANDGETEPPPTPDPAAEDRGESAKLSQPVLAEQPEDPEPVAKKPLTSDHFQQVERAIASLDATPFMRRRDIHLQARDAEAQPIIHEYFADLDAVADALLPGYDFAADRWLHGRLCDLVANRFLAARPEISATASLAAMVPLTVRTILGDSFEAFDHSLKGLPRNRIIVSIALFDALYSGADYAQARQRLRRAGYRSSLRNLDVFTFPMINRDQFDAAFEEITFRAADLRQLSGPYLEAFSRAVRQAGPARLILRGTQDKAIIDFGQSVGIRLFEGPADTI